MWNEIVEVCCNILSQSSSEIGDDAACQSNALIIIPLKGPNNILAELINIDFFSYSIDQATQSDKSIFCYSFESLEDHD